MTIKFVSDAPDLVVDIDRGTTAAALTEEVRPCALDACELPCQAPAHHTERR